MAAGSAGLLVPPVDSSGGVLPAIAPPPPVVLDYSQTTLPLEALLAQTQAKSDGFVVEQAEIGSDGAYIALRFRAVLSAGDGGTAGFALWAMGDPAPLHVVDGLDSPLHDLRLGLNQLLSCSDDGELLLWEWNDSEIVAASRWLASGRAINACALSWKGKVAACGLVGGLTALLSRHTSRWAVPPPFLGIPKMAPDGWENTCQVTGEQFTRWNRKHHCRRCGRLISNEASVMGAPTDPNELEDALRQVTPTLTTLSPSCGCV